VKAICTKCGYTKTSHELGAVTCDAYDDLPVIPGEIVLINTEPKYGDWNEAVVIDVVESVVVKIYDHTVPLADVIADPDNDYDEIIVPLKNIIKLPKEEK